MARTEQAIFTVMVMVTDSQGRLLVQDRINPTWPGVCFPGGHAEPGEPFTEAAIREVREETGLMIEDPRLCGVKQFQTQDGVRYVVFFYRSCHFSGILTDSPEGRVFWIPREDLTNYSLADDFLDMVKVFESEDLSEFFYVQEDGSWDVKLL